MIWTQFEIIWNFELRIKLNRRLLLLLGPHLSSSHLSLLSAPTACAARHPHPLASRRCRLTTAARPPNWAPPQPPTCGAASISPYFARLPPRYATVKRAQATALAPFLPSVPHSPRSTVQRLSSTPYLWSKPGTGARAPAPELVESPLPPHFLPPPRWELPSFGASSIGAAPHIPLARAEL
jgi:hypothetical protein